MVFSISAIISSSILVPVNVRADAEAITPDSSLATEPSTEPVETMAVATTEPSSDISPIEPTTALAQTETDPTVSAETPVATESTTEAAVSPTPPEPVPDISNESTVATESAQQTATGDITAQGNDDIESAQTGNADGAVTIKNEVNNITTPSSGEVTVLSVTPANDTDYVLNPQSATTAPASVLDTTQEDLVIVNTTDINNLVVTDSTSGAIVANNNDDIGNMTTGNAVSDAAILNLANNVVATGDVFVGVITIEGDYNQDIVLSQALIDYLLQGSNASASGLIGADLQIESLEVIDNNVSANAVSGDVQLDDNDDVGNITTGNANTFVIIKNIAGNYILYGNSLVIIVNVTGAWNGDVLGSSQAATILGNDGNGGLLALSPSELGSDQQKVLITNNTSISNSVKASAISGGITAIGNDDLGDLTTGDATVRVTIMNILNNIVSFSDWLGVLFINIFGDWNGSVKLQEKAAPTITPMVTQLGYSPPTISPATSSGAFVRNVFRPTNNDITQAPTTVVAAAAIAPDAFGLPTTLLSPAETSSSWLWLMFIALLGGGLFAGNRVYALREL